MCIFASMSSRLEKRRCLLAVFAILQLSREFPTNRKSNIMNPYIEQAKVMSKGQVTIPKEIRELLGLSEGSRVSFIVNGDQVIMENSAICALKFLQQEMKGEAEKAGIRDEEDAISLIKESR